MNLGEMEDVFIPKISKNKKLSHFLHRFQGLEDPLLPFQSVFLIAQKSSLSHIIAELVMNNGRGILTNRKRFILVTSSYIITFLIFPTHVTYWENRIHH